ncbi:MAG: hypothetical protein QOG03_529 [Actinomycetota bacterium]|jgi:hypothetical protein|nr:hypothetical protein [Actinomycetota bacterium]
MDRRVPFFLVSAVVAFLLVIPSPEKFRGICEVTGVVYIILAALTALDSFGKPD